MKNIARMMLENGMILAEDVLDFQGNLLFPANTIITDQIISRLSRYSIMCVNVKEDKELANTHYEKLHLDEMFKAFQIIYQDALYKYKAIIVSLIENHTKFEDNKLISLYQNVTSFTNSPSLLLDYLYNMMSSEDELTHIHCFNSALLAGTFAEWLHLSEQEKHQLILCAFYYDIGKLKIPNYILWKSEKLTNEEFELVKTHTTIGYKILEAAGIRDTIKRATLMHHERMDGTGYPYKLIGNKIDPAARFLAIVDTYEAMSSPRSYRETMHPLNIIAHFEHNIAKYDSELLLPLIKRIADSMIGTSVQLSNSSIWEVFIINSHQLSRPILKNDNNEILDLFTNKELSIVKTV